MPKTVTIKVKIRLHKYDSGKKKPSPSKMSRNNSIGAVTGLHNAAVRIQPWGSWDKGYTTGVPYIQSCIPNSTSTNRSLYFVVKLEIMIPTPIPIRPSCKSRNGRTNHSSKCGLTFPFKQ